MECRTGIGPRMARGPRSVGIEAHPVKASASGGEFGQPYTFCYPYFVLTSQSVRPNIPDMRYRACRAL